MNSLNPPQLQVCQRSPKGGPAAESTPVVEKPKTFIGTSSGLSANPLAPRKHEKRKMLPLSNQLEMVKAPTPSTVDPLKRARGRPRKPVQPPKPPGFSKNGKRLGRPKKVVVKVEAGLEELNGEKRTRGRPRKVEAGLEAGMEGDDRAVSPKEPALNGEKTPGRPRKDATMLKSGTQEDVRPESPRPPALNVEKRNLRRLRKDVTMIPKESQANAKVKKECGDVTRKPQKRVVKDPKDAKQPKETNNFKEALNFLLSCGPVEEEDNPPVACEKTKKKEGENPRDLEDRAETPDSQLSPESDEEEDQEEDSSPVTFRKIEKQENCARKQPKQEVKDTQDPEDSKDRAEPESDQEEEEEGSTQEVSKKTRKQPSRSVKSRKDAMTSPKSESLESDEWEEEEEAAPKPNKTFPPANPEVYELLRTIFRRKKVWSYDEKIEFCEENGFDFKQLQYFLRNKRWRERVKLGKHLGNGDPMSETKYWQLFENGSEEEIDKAIEIIEKTDLSGPREKSASRIELEAIFMRKKYWTKKERQAFCKKHGLVEEKLMRSLEHMRITDRKALGTNGKMMKIDNYRQLFENGTGSQIKTARGLLRDFVAAKQPQARGPLGFYVKAEKQMVMERLSGSQGRREDEKKAPKVLRGPKSRRKEDCNASAIPTVASPATPIPAENQDSDDETDDTEVVRKHLPWTPKKMKLTDLEESFDYFPSEEVQDLNQAYLNSPDLATEAPKHANYQDETHSEPVQEDLDRAYLNSPDLVTDDSNHGYHQEDESHLEAVQEDLEQGGSETTDPPEEEEEEGPETENPEPEEHQQMNMDRESPDSSYNDPPEEDEDPEFESHDPEEHHEIHPERPRSRFDESEEDEHSKLPSRPEETITNEEDEQDSDSSEDYDEDEEAEELAAAAARASLLESLRPPKLETDVKRAVLPPYMSFSLAYWSVDHVRRWVRGLNAQKSLRREIELCVRTRKINGDRLEQLATDDNFMRFGQGLEIDAETCRLFHRHARAVVNRNNRWPEEE